MSTNNSIATIVETTYPNILDSMTDILPPSQIV